MPRLHKLRNYVSERITHPLRYAEFRSKETPTGHILTFGRVKRTNEWELQRVLHPLSCPRVRGKYEVNPDTDVEEAKEMYKVFQDLEPDSIQKIEIPEPAYPLEYLGKLEHVVYYCSKWNKKNTKYIHRWKKHKLEAYQDQDGNIWLFGKVTVTEDGIEDYHGARQDYSKLQIPKVLTYLGVCLEIKTSKGGTQYLDNMILCCDKKGEHLYIVPFDLHSRKLTHPDL